MQDGIHKNAPVPKEWKAVVKACEFDGWEANGFKECQKLIINKLKELKPTIKTVQILLSEEQKDLYPNLKLHEIVHQQDTDQQDVYLKKDFLNALDRHLDNEETQPIFKACISALHKYREKHRRNIARYLEQKFPKDQAEMNNRLNQVEQSLDSIIVQLAKSLIDGKKLKLIPLPRITIAEAISYV